MHSLAVYVTEGLPFAQDIYLQKTLHILTYVLDWLYFIHCLTSFSSMTFYGIMRSFYSISSNIDEVLSINPSANVGDFNVHDKDWLSYSAGTNRPCELCYNFSISNNLTQILTVLFFWISFL